METTRNVGPPGAEREIEVALAIALTVRRMLLGHRLARVCLQETASEGGQGDQDTIQGTFLTTTKPPPMHLAPAVQVIASRAAWYL